MKEALLYNKVGDEFVQCSLCAHRCKIAPEKFGFCAVRQNIKGVLCSHVYGKPIAMHVDPIEKKPLYHFLPGSTSFSIATIGCNFRCGFCQNWEISQARINPQAGDVPAEEEFSPEQIVALALKHKCESISYTYTEPTIFFEYAYETARLAKEKGLCNNFVTNGYMTEEALTMVRPYLDAANIDLKFFRDESYRNICKAALKPVLDSICLMKKLGIWVEVTTLVVPGENDSEEELKDIAGFIAGVDKDIPWHISRFFPNYEFSDKGATPESALKKAAALGKAAGLRYVYAGNVAGWGSDTYCHNCKKLIIGRQGFSVLEQSLTGRQCAFCKTAIPGVFSV